MDPRDIHDTIRAVSYRNGVLELLDQRKLPALEEYIECRNAEDVAIAIRDLVVRGAPAIGIAAAWGVALEATRLREIGERSTLQTLDPSIYKLKAARPTAVNLAWALARMRGVLELDHADVVAALEAEAKAIQDEDLAANRHMGQLGADLIAAGSSVMTHCNTGSLATAGYGTALGVIRAGVTNGKITHVYAGETRPWLQGARLTMWELVRDKIPAKLIADSAAAHLMKSGAVQWVIVGADRIAANGDTANKIGTHQLAIVAKHYGVKFMVVAPSSTVDMTTENGNHIEIELRHPEELFGIAAGTRHVVEGADAWNPVFDVTPADLIDALVTERGVIEEPNVEKMKSMFALYERCRDGLVKKSSWKQLLTFCFGGFIGFVVDAGVLQLLVVFLSWDRYTARLISFVCAATATWIFNRQFTFKGPRRQPIVVEWMQYVFAMSWGFACNFAAYSALVYFFNLDGPWLIGAVAAGSLAGLGVNYTASRYWVFRHPKKSSDG